MVVAVVVAVVVMVMVVSECVSGNDKEVRTRSERRLLNAIEAADKASPTPSADTEAEADKAEPTDEGEDLADKLMDGTAHQDRHDVFYACAYSLATQEGPPPER